MKSGIAVLAAVVTLGVAVPSRACCEENSRPAPACPELNHDDSRGDVDNKGLDLVGAFLSSRGRQVHANLVVDYLDGSVGDGDIGNEFYIVDYYDDSGAFRTAQARLYENGARTGATWFDGPDGIVRIALPDLDPKTSTKLSVITGWEPESTRVEINYRPVREILREHADGRLLAEEADRIELSETTAMCANRPAPPAPPAAPTEPAPEPESAPAPQVTIGTPLRARGKTLRVPLRSTARVTDLRGKLSRNGRVVARGRLAELDGKGVLVLTARRTIARGVYVLTIPGVAERMRLRIG